LRKAARRQHKSETDLAETAIEEFLQKAKNTGKVVGLFANEPATIDQILSQAMDDREKVPL
jgi:2-keto-3-deoxy-L-rhamnonate aldolase RhmA